MKKPKRVTLPLRDSPDDAWFDLCDEAAAKQMAYWLRESINVMRPINSLSLAEMKLLARVATDHWIKMQSFRKDMQAPYREMLASFV